MSRKIKLLETSVTQPIQNNDVEVIEDINYVKQPDFSILDVTVIPDEEYNPTIQSILIDLDESNSLKESESLGLGFNVLSETVNEKTGYSHSLFEFESKNNTITLNLSLTESDKYSGVYKVLAHTTKGEQIFESNTTRPKEVIKNFLNSLCESYLVEGNIYEEPIKTTEATVYQIFNTEKSDYAFMPWDKAKDKFNIDDYTKVATVEVPDSDNALETVFSLGNTDKSSFNITGPMRSVSVSDVIEVNGEKYYVDSFGFEELSN